MSGSSRTTANLPRLIAAAAALAVIVVACVLGLQAGDGNADAPGAREVATPPAVAAEAAGTRAADEVAAVPAQAAGDPPTQGSDVVETVIGSKALADVRAGETVVVNFVVPRRATVSGVVREDGRPRSGIVVRHRRVLPPVLCHLAYQHWCGPSAETATSSADGRFEQSIPYGDDIALWAVGPDNRCGPEVRISLTSGSRFEVELALPPRRK